MQSDKILKYDEIPVEVKDFDFIILLSSKSGY